MSRIVPDYSDLDPRDDEDENADRCFLCGSLRVDDVLDNYDMHLPVCASCASDKLLPCAFRAIAAGVRRRGDSEAEHLKVLNEIQRQYRSASGLSVREFVAFLERGKKHNQRNG
jgi:hypothetical protein